MSNDFELISIAFLEAYSAKFKEDSFEPFPNSDYSHEISIEDFEYYIVASSLFSSKIEGNSLDLNSFYNYRAKKDFPKVKEVEEIENLVSAYKFASENVLNEVNFLKVHSLLSKTLLKAAERGKYRKHQVGIRDSASGRPVYMAVEPQFVTSEMQKLFSDIEFLMKQQLSAIEIFYYASMIHLWIAMIHPFGDGNGRAARLLEKWFLASKFGMKAWSIRSEKYYWDRRPEYYQNIALGFNYYALHWERCIPFLFMLPEAV